MHEPRQRGVVLGSGGMAHTKAAELIRYQQIKLKYITSVAIQISL